jgi:hypothetical protein
MIWSVFSDAHVFNMQQSQVLDSLKILSTHFSLFLADADQEVVSGILPQLEIVKKLFSLVLDDVEQEPSPDVCLDLFQELKDVFLPWLDICCQQPEFQFEQADAALAFVLQKFQDKHLNLFEECFQWFGTLFFSNSHSWVHLVSRLEAFDWGKTKYKISSQTTTIFSEVLENLPSSLMSQDVLLRFLLFMLGRVDVKSIGSDEPTLFSFVSSLLKLCTMSNKHTPLCMFPSSLASFMEMFQVGSLQFSPANLLNLFAFFSSRIPVLKEILEAKTMNYWPVFKLVIHVFHSLACSEHSGENPKLTTLRKLCLLSNWYNTLCSSIDVPDSEYHEVVDLSLEALDSCCRDLEINSSGHPLSFNASYVIMNLISCRGARKQLNSCNFVISVTCQTHPVLLIHVVNAICRSVLNVHLMVKLLDAVLVQYIGIHGLDEEIWIGISSSIITPSIDFDDFVSSMFTQPSVWGACSILMTLFGNDSLDIDASQDLAESCLEWIQKVASPTDSLSEEILQSLLGFLLEWIFRSMRMPTTTFLSSRFYRMLVATCSSIFNGDTFSNLFDKLGLIKARFSNRFRFFCFVLTTLLDAFFGSGSDSDRIKGCQERLYQYMATLKLSIEIDPISDLFSTILSSRDFSPGHFLLMFQFCSELVFRKSLLVWRV